ncbi:hypothetical protein LTR15_012812 [Elasticomyces elasticus]|nr:hypothetical protein LTR15_012812 [Elasticomyces elasticus]
MSEKETETVSHMPASTSPSILEGKLVDITEDNEVFKKGVDGVEFRTVSWQRATIIFVKYTVATGLLGIPSALNTLVIARTCSNERLVLTICTVGGGLNIVGWGAMNAYTSVIAGDFKINHPECHTIVDMSRLIWGNIVAEFVSLLLILGYVLCTASAILGISTALNAVSENGACTAVFSFVGLIMTVMFASIRTWSSMTWPLAISFFCVMAAVLAVVIGSAQLKRPSAAPQTGPYDFGFVAIRYPTFAAGITAANAIFASSTGCPGTIPIISEMRQPTDFRRVTINVGCIVTVIYLVLSMTMYSYVGQWIASPSLGSAGPLIKKVAYGVALPSLVVSAGLFNHVSAKYIFVRVLRGTKHLQSNSLVHWSTWLGLNLGLGVLAYVFAEAVPVFNYLLALLASVCFAPMSIMLPPLFWMADHKHYLKAGTKEKVIYAAHVGILLIGSLMCVGGM